MLLTRHLGGVGALTTTAGRGHVFPHSHRSVPAAHVACNAWPVKGWSQQTHQLHVFWDLDNKRPDEAAHYPVVVKALKAELQRGGRIAQLRAYANLRTCAEHDADTLGALVLREAPADGLRCSLCGRRCKSAEDLKKHFKQLHQSEHRKRMSGPPKRVGKYLDSPKAARYREGASSAGMSKRLGAKGSTLKMLLSTLGCTLLDVPPGDQAADEALVRHATKLLSTQPAVPPATPAGKSSPSLMRSTAVAASAKKSTPSPMGNTAAAAPADQSSLSTMRNALVIVSDDAGFVPLLQSAGARGWGSVLVCSAHRLPSFQGRVDACVEWENVYPVIELYDEGESDEDEFDMEEYGYGEMFY